jgi:non-heme chloroperoxidase
MSRGLKIFVIVVVAVVVAIAAALAGMLAFGTSAPPQELTSLGAPFRKVDFSDLPAVQTLTVSNRSPIAYRSWQPNPDPSDPPLVVIAIHGSSAQSTSIHPLGKA